MRAIREGELPSGIASRNPAILHPASLRRRSLPAPSRALRAARCARCPRTCRASRRTRGN
eukprot:4968663-Alexandrium_andersonii.AAC.1